MLILIANFLIVLVAILVFTAPFFIWYSLVHKDKRIFKDFNRYLEDFFSSRQSNWLIFGWAASEAVFWFVIPEFLLLLIVFMRIRRKRQMLVYDISGTLFGTTIALLMRMPESTLDKIPYIQTKMITQTHSWFHEIGILGLVHQPFSGVPYKVFTNTAWAYSFSLLLFIVSVLPDAATLPDEIIALA